MPVVPSVGTQTGVESAVDWISDNDPGSTVEKSHCIPKPILIRIREDQLPRVAAVGGFVEAREVALAARHDDGGIGVEGLDATKVEMLGAGRNGTLLPEVAAVFGAQDRAVGSRGSGHASAHIVDAAQVGSGTGVFDGPLGMRRDAAAEGKAQKKDGGTHGQQCTAGSRNVSGLHLTTPHPTPVSVNNWFVLFGLADGFRGKY